MTITNIENKDVITVSSLKTNDTQSKFAKFSSSDF